VQIQVADPGIGVPAGEREKIFAPYYRGSNQHFAAGTGVGLYICRELAHKMGGSLRYAPNPDGGSLFRLRLERVASPPPAAAPAPSIGIETRTLMLTGQPHGER
jgi:signal transduction histidine kinase